MRFPSVVRFASLLVLLSAAVSSAAPAPGKQTSEVYEAGGQKLGYLLYLPADYGKDAAKRWPVILFLHGSGERGEFATDLAKVKKHGPPKVAEQRKGFGFVVVSPQCPPNLRWEPAQLKGLLDEVLTTKAKQADRDRVYLTGLSMGGAGTWSLAAAHPEMFAAVAPVCGRTDPATADRIKSLPIWVFHGDKDTAVKVEQSVQMVDALKAAGAKDVQFTRYPDLAHDSWTATYDNPKLYEWFLSHKRKAS